MSVSHWGLIAACVCALASARADDLKINAGGKLIVRSQVKLDSGNVVVGANGTLDLESGKIIASGVNVQLNGLLTGSGTIEGGLTSDGTVDLASPISLLAVTGNVLFNSHSMLKLALGGLTTGNFSFISANGTVTVGGTLAIGFFNGFESSITDTDILALIQSGSPILGAFTNIATAGVLTTSDDLGTLSVHYDTSVLVVTSFTSLPPPTTLLYVTGDGVSGEPGTTKFGTFGVPSINSFGELAFSTKLSTANGPQEGIVAGSPVTVAFRKGDKAIGPIGPEFASFGDPMLNATGEVAFNAKLAGDGVNIGNRSGIWTNAGGTLALVARARDNASGVTDAKISSLIAAGLTDMGAVPYIATMFGKGVPFGTARALWVWESTGTTLLLRQGTAITFAGEPARKLTGFAALAPVNGSPGQARGTLGNAVLCRVRFSDGLTAIAEVSPTVRRLIAKSGATVPTIPGGARFASFGLPAYNANGDAAFLAKLTVGVAGVTVTNSSAIFADTAVVDTGFVARTGSFAPGVLPAKFVSLSDPVYNAARDVAFIGRLNIGATGIWWKNGDTLKLVALRDEHPPGTPAGARWLTFPSVALPDGTGAAPAFVARMQSGLGRVNVLNRVGLWAIDRAGVIRLVARTGDSVLVHGTPPAKKIASLSFLPLVLGSPDHPRSYNDAAQFTYKATFTDNTQAVFRVDLP